MRNLLKITLICLFIIVPASAKPRAVRVAGSTVLFKSSVVDATTGKPVFGAQVANGTATTTTDPRGAFSLLLPSLPANLVVSRSGYDTASFTVTASAVATPVPFRLQSHPGVVVQTTDGQSITLDVESARFVNALPLMNPVSETSGTFCKDGNEVDIELADISRITGPSVVTAGSSCCSHDVEWIDVTQKSGEQSHVSLIYSCRGYDVFLGGREHETFQQTFIRFSDIRQVTVP